MPAELMDFMEAASSLATDMKASRDPDDPDLIIVGMRFPRDLLDSMREELSRSYASLEDRYGKISEKGMDDEGVDAWAYIEDRLSNLDSLVKKIENYGDVIGTIEVRKEGFGILVYPRGSLSGFAVNLTYSLARLLPKEAVTFSLIGYELTRDFLEISFYVSTREECTPEEANEHGHENG